MHGEYREGIDEEIPAVDPLESDLLLRPVGRAKEAGTLRYRGVVDFRACGNDASRIMLGCRMEHSQVEILAGAFAQTFEIAAGVGPDGELRFDQFGNHLVGERLRINPHLSHRCRCRHHHRHPPLRRRG